MKKLTLLAAGMIGFILTAHAQWQTMSGFPGGPFGRVKALTTLGDLVFAGTEIGGVFMSSDSGNTWTSRNTGLISSVRAFAVSGTSIIAGTTNGVSYSADSGKSWTAVSSMANAYVMSLAVYNNTVVAGTFGNGIYYSTDAGRTFTSSANTDGLAVRSLALRHSSSNDSLFIAACGNQGIFFSYDGGKTWANVWQDLNAEMTAAGVSGNMLLAGSYCTGGIYPSGGWVYKYAPPTYMTWTQDNGLHSQVVSAVSAITAGTVGLYVAFNQGGCNGGGVVESFDQGQHWNKSNLVESVDCLASSVKYIYAGTTSGKVWRSYLR